MKIRRKFVRLNVCLFCSWHSLCARDETNDHESNSNERTNFFIQKIIVLFIIISKRTLQIGGDEANRVIVSWQFSLLAQRELFDGVGGVVDISPIVARRGLTLVCACVL